MSRSLRSPVPHTSLHGADTKTPVSAPFRSAAALGTGTKTTNQYQKNRNPNASAHKITRKTVRNHSMPSPTTDSIQQFKELAFSGPQQECLHFDTPELTLPCPSSSDTSTTPRFVTTPRARRQSAARGQPNVQGVRQGREKNRKFSTDAGEKYRICPATISVLNR